MTGDIYNEWESHLREVRETCRDVQATPLYAGDPAVLWQRSAMNGRIDLVAVYAGGLAIVWCNTQASVKSSRLGGTGRLKMTYRTDVGKR